jgi:hypothetical protein
MHEILQNDCHGVSIFREFSDIFFGLQRNFSGRRYVYRAAIVAALLKISSSARSPRGPSNDGCLPICPKRLSAIVTSNLGGIAHLPPIKRWKFSGLPSNAETNAMLMRCASHRLIARDQPWS